MGHIYKPVTLIGALGTKTLTALMDTTASWSYIRKDEAMSIAPPYKVAEPIAVRLGKVASQADEVMISDVEFGGYRMYGTFIIVPELTEELIIGADFLQLWKIKLDPMTEEIIIDPSALQLQLI